MNDADATMVRFMKYLLPVIALSILFNIPKFFEAEFVGERVSANRSDVFVDYDDGGSSSIDVTALRKNPDYVIYYHNWARLAVLGIIPFVMLVYFNTKIYNDLQVGHPRLTVGLSEDTTGSIRFAFWIQG